LKEQGRWIPAYAGMTIKKQGGMHLAPSPSNG
jgi:hypothetical protein